MYEHLKPIKQQYQIVGNHEALNVALDTALQVAGADFNVLVLGENGSGKDVIARMIHNASPRSKKPFKAVNCGGLPEGTIDSELFGHEKGAFTGAVESRKGLFGDADGGTLFLDEIGELPISMQARLLRVLDSGGEYIPVGSTIVHKANVRIIAATNRNLPEAIRKGRFRMDLYYRLCGATIQLPPLRERGEDITLIFRKFALDMKQKYRMEPVRLDVAAEQMLRAYSWPGNVRQLRNVVEALSYTSPERTITPEILKPYLPEEHLTGLTVAGERQDGSISYEKDRAMIFQMLISLRNEVENLKQQLHGTRGTDASTKLLQNSLPETNADIEEIL